MECKKCGKANEADSKTCKQCGQSLEVVRTLTSEEHIRIGELIYAAYKHKEAGAIDDAIMACQGALALNDASAQTHSLLASLYTHKGDIASAMYEYERSLELDPGNIASKQKLEELKTSPAPPPPTITPPTTVIGRMGPFAPYAAFAIVFVVALIGLTLLLRDSEAEKSPGTAQTNVPHTTAPIQPHSQPMYPQTQGQPQPQPQAQYSIPQAQAQQQPAPIQSPPPQRIETLPQPAPERAPVQRAPIIPPTQPIPRERPIIEPVVEQEPTPPPVIIRTPSQPAADPEQTAMSLQGSGKYQEAISAYKEALNRTSDSGRIYQQIALCYQRLGQHDQATSNYNLAIRSYRDQLSAGRDPAEVNRNIRACEAGLEVSRNR